MSRIPPPDNLYSNKRKREEDLIENLIDEQSILNMPKFQDQPYESFEFLNSKPLKQKKISRWSNIKVYLPGHPMLVPWGLNEEMLNAFLLRARLDEVNNRLAGEIVLDKSERRSPSPEPIYDNRGIRANTRDQRLKKKLQQERQDLIHQASEMYPMFRVPSEIHQEPKKVTQKIWIPMDTNPEYNFIGLIIGPRGKTQKQMERESRSKIAIRGKGSVKPGRGRKDGKLAPGEDEDLHVLVTADNDKSIAMATEMIEKLLIPIEEGKNELKREQLRDLARIHGTLRDEDPNAPTTSILDQRPLLENLENYGKKNAFSSTVVSTLESNQKNDQDYDAFKSSLQNNAEQGTEEMSQTDAQHHLSTIFQPNSLMMQPSIPGIIYDDENPIGDDVPPIIPGIFNLIPTLHMIPGLPEKFPWEK
jgi:hypothetical protein